MEISSAISELLSQWGAPGLVCAALAWALKYVYDNHRKDMESMRKTLENNTKAINSLVASLPPYRGVREKVEESDNE